MKNEKIVIVMPAYNAEQTLYQTLEAISKEYRDHIILVDDKSNDNTVQLARKLGLTVIRHKDNLGYGGNQKTCYKAALKAGADVIVMIHPDYQYAPELIAPMVAMIQTGIYDCVLGSRILGGGALKGGMPVYKYIGNRFLTVTENIVTGGKLSEYHTGLRAFRREVLETVKFESNSNNYVFDNQILLQIFAKGFRIGEISCPTRYFKEASSATFMRSVVYGFSCLYWGLMYGLGQLKIYRHPLLFGSL